MQDIVRVGFLFDIYEKLLTEKQKMVLGYYINDNFSLSEISETMYITRQAAHDIIRRTVKHLEDYESKLKLYEKLVKNRKLLDEIKASSWEDKEKIIDRIQRIIER